MSIIHHSDRIEISLPVAKALLAFSGQDATRAHLGIGFRDGMLCATDGNVLLAFDAECRVLGEGCGPSWATLDAIINGKYWTSATLELGLKIARATKNTTLCLSYAQLADGFPPAQQIIPSYGIELTEPIKIDPEFLGRMSLVCKACGDTGAVLVSAKGSCDPVMFRVGEDTELKARVIIMPMRRGKAALKSRLSRKSRARKVA